MTHDRAFGDFQFEKLRRQARSLKRLARGFLYATTGKLKARDIYRQDTRGQPGGAPGCPLRHGRLLHPLADLDDQPGLFRQANEIGRQEHALRRV